MSSENYFISIIIPTFNSCELLLSMLQDIHNQTFHDYEIIIIDDGSTDNTKEALKNSYIDHKYLYQENRGVSSARNLGIRNASGKYICFVDADDGLEKDFLEGLANAAIKSDADLIIGGYKFIEYSSGKIKEIRNAKEWDVKFDSYHNVFQYSPWGKLFKNDLLKNNGIFFSEGEQIEDGPFSIITNMLSENLISTNETKYLYYDRESSESQIKQIANKNRRVSLPYNAISNSITLFNNSKFAQSKREMFEYCVLKELVGLTTNVGKAFNNETRKELCSYCNKILSEYFPNVARNKYARLFSLGKLPFVHRAAIKLFLISYKCDILYLFSLLVSKVL